MGPTEAVNAKLPDETAVPLFFTDYVAARSMAQWMMAVKARSIGKPAVELRFATGEIPKEYPQLMPTQTQEPLPPETCREFGYKFP